MILLLLFLLLLQAKRIAHLIPLTHCSLCSSDLFQDHQCAPALDEAVR
jgi:hypothetical protein